MTQNSGLKGIRTNHTGYKPNRQTFQSRYYRQKRPLEECFKSPRSRNHGLSLREIRENHEGNKPTRFAFQSRYYSKGGAKIGMTDEMRRYCFYHDVSILTKKEEVNP